MSALPWLLQDAAATAPVAPRTFSGNLCGVRVPGLPFVNGGSADTSLVLSWFYPRYSNPADRAKIRQAWADRGYWDVTTSWQDDADIGLSYEQIVEYRQELCVEGFRPAEMLLSKVYSPRDDAAGCLQILQPMLDQFLAADCISRYSVGWELNLFNTYASLQALTDAIAPQVLAKNRMLYVHFSPGYADWRPDHPGSTFAEYWNAQVGKLCGLWHQAVSDWSPDEYRGRLADILERFNGAGGTSPDSGFGHPFDLIELEITAIDQFYGTCTEAQGDAKGTFAIDSPPIGNCRVMGSGNGQV